MWYNICASASLSCLCWTTKMHGWSSQGGPANSYLSLGSAVGKHFWSLNFTTNWTFVCAAPFAFITCSKVQTCQSGKLPTPAWNGFASQTFWILRAISVWCLLKRRNLGSNVIKPSESVPVRARCCILGCGTNFRFTRTSPKVFSVHLNVRFWLDLVIQYNLCENFDTIYYALFCTWLWVPGNHFLFRRDG